MKKLFKFFLYFILTVIVLIALAIGAIVFLINPSDYKNTINTQMSQLLGRPLVINGDIQWSFYPWLGIEVKQIQISNPANFKGPFATLEKATLHVHFMSLLKKELAISNIELNNLNVHLHRKNSTTNNWQDLLGNPNKKKSTTIKRYSLIPFAYTISGIDIKHGNFVYQDDEKHQTLTLQDVNFQANDLRFQRKAKTTDSNSPWAILRYLKLNASMDIGKFAYADTVITDAHSQINVQQGKLKLSSLSAKLLNGEFNGDIEIDGQTNKPQYMLKGKFANIDAKLIFDRWLKAKSFALSGTANLQTHLSSSGITTDELNQNLIGKFDLVCTKGILYGVDVTHQIKVAEAIFTKQPAPTTDNTRQTPFDSLSASTLIKQRIATTKSIRLESPDFNISGDGAIDFPNQILNYRLAVNLRTKDLAPQLIDLQQILGGSIPLHITGTLQQFKVYPDARTILIASAKYYLQQPDSLSKGAAVEKLQKLSQNLQGNLAKMLG